MKKIILLLLITISNNGFGQCIDGDCENGVGTYLWEDGSISNGSWKDGKLNGIVQEIVYDDQGNLMGIFDGNMNMGVISGWGTETLYSNDGYLLGTYVGFWADGDYNGWGIWIDPEQRIEKGIWVDGDLVREF